MYLVYILSSWSNILTNLQVGLLACYIWVQPISQWPILWIFTSNSFKRFISSSSTGFVKVVFYSPVYKPMTRADPQILVITFIVWVVVPLITGCCSLQGKTILLTLTMILTLFKTPNNFWTKIALFFGTYCNHRVKIPTDKL